MRRESQLLADVCEALQESPRSIEGIAVDAGVTAVTLYAWMSGATKHPYCHTIEKVAAALGKRVELKDGIPRIMPTTAPDQHKKRNGQGSGWRQWIRDN